MYFSITVLRIKADIIEGVCLYVCMKFSGISKRTVQGIVSLSYACFAVVYRASADAEFGADFGLSHAVHIAVQNGEFQGG